MDRYGQIASSYDTSCKALLTGLPPFISDAKGQILLTKREEQIVSKVAEGMKNREIAESLNVSEHTLKNHLFRVFERLGISSRAELILYLQAQGPCVNRHIGTAQSTLSDGDAKPHDL